MIQTWDSYAKYCKSQNSTLIILEENEKFEYFRNVSKYLGSSKWVTFLKPFDKHQEKIYQNEIQVGSVDNEDGNYKWNNNAPLNTSFLDDLNTIVLGNCLALSSASNFKLQGVSCALSSQGICEYSEKNQFFNLNIN